jgi:hypothetical protein
MPRLLGGAAVLVATSVAIAAAEPSLDKAKAAIDQSDYLGAQKALGDALAAGDNGPDQLVEIYKLTGTVAGALGDAKAAQDAFTRCLALDPKAVLPPGTSPKITKPFTAAKAALKGKEALKIKTETSGDPPSITVVVVSDPLQMIAKVRAIVVVDMKPEKTIDRASPGADSTTLQLPVGQRLDVRVAVLDDKGNRLAELGTKDVPIVIVGPKVTGTTTTTTATATTNTTVTTLLTTKKPEKDTKPPQKSWPLYLRWWLWGGAAVVVGGTGIYFGIDAVRAKNDLDELNRTSSNHTFDEALSVKHHVERSVLLANIGMIAGGAFAATAGVLYLIRPKSVSKERIAVGPLVTGGAGGVVLGGHF